MSVVTVTPKNTLLFLIQFNGFGADGRRMSQLLRWPGAKEAAKDIQSSFILIVKRFMAVLMNCLCCFEADDESKCQAGAANVKQSCVDGAGSSE